MQESFSSEDCKPEVMTKYHKMSDIDFRWTYKKGDKTIDMGFMNDELIRHRLRECVMEKDPFRHKDGKLFWKHFIRFGFTFPHMRIAKNYSKAREVFEQLSKGMGYIDLEMINNYTREEVKLVVRLIESPHGKTFTFFERGSILFIVSTYSTVEFRTLGSYAYQAVSFYSLSDHTW